MLKIKDNVDLKELEKFGWEVDSSNCIFTCEECKKYNRNCFPLNKRKYRKHISNFLQFTTLHLNLCENNNKITPIFDEYEEVKENEKCYEYVLKSIEKEIQAGIIEKVSDK